MRLVKLNPMGAFKYFLLSLCLVCTLTPPLQAGNGPSLTTVNDILYRADGTPSQGTMTISWPEFTTANGSAVAAGSMAVTIGAGGVVNLSLAPNAGAVPAGTFYKVVTKDTTGVTATEYWVVPAVVTTTLATIRTQMLPANIAAQAATRAYVDQLVVHNTGNEAIAEIKSFSSTPNVPDPQNATDVANKEYVDNASKVNVPALLGYTPENVANKDAASGYAGLSANGQLNTNEFQTIPFANLPVGTMANTVAAGNDARLASAAQTNAWNMFSQQQSMTDVVLGSSSPWYIDVRWYGAKGDGKYITDAAMTSGSPALTSNMGRFSCPTDVGRAIWVQAAGPSGATLQTTIASCTDSNHITLSMAASATIASLSISDAAMTSGKQCADQWVKQVFGRNGGLHGLRAWSGCERRRVANDRRGIQRRESSDADCQCEHGDHSADGELPFHAVIGTDDTPALQAAIDGAKTRCNAGGGTWNLCHTLLLDLLDRAMKSDFNVVLLTTEITAGMKVKALATQAGELPLVPDWSLGYAGTPGSGTAVLPAYIVQELKAHMRWVVGSGNQGKIQEMEERLNRHETHLQRLVGVGSALAAAITVMNLIANFLRLHREEVTGQEDESL